MNKADYIHKDTLTATDYVELNKNNEYVAKLENQQKEFIKYLEEEISKWHYNYDSNNYEYEIEEPTAEELLVSALSKYQEIIVGKE